MKTPLLKQSPVDILRNNIVTVLFIVLCVGAYFASGLSLTFLLPELFTRISRNTFMVLSLIIPVVAGMGLNFGIVIGAISAQIGIFFSLYFGFTGFTAILIVLAICIPLSVVFGFLVGKLFNSMKGSEMIGGLVLGYFADGVYQFLFLYVLGGLIPLGASTLLIPGGVGVKASLDLAGIKYAIDNVPMLRILEIGFYVVIAVLAVQLVYRLIKKQDLKIKKWAITLVGAIVVYALSFIPAIEKFLSTDRLALLDALLIGVIVAVLLQVYRIVRYKAIDKKAGLPVKNLIFIGVAVVAYALTFIPALETGMMAVNLPVLTYISILALYLFISWFLKTRLGQNMRTVGQNRAVAASAGIDVDKTRIIAMIMSTVFASFGQLVSLQNIGTFSTYGAHTSVGLYAVAALLVGGASVQRATTKQAVLGVILFHTLFILSPQAGKALLGNAQVGEYFRVFVAYGVIAVALALHAWGRVSSKKKAKA